MRSALWSLKLTESWSERLREKGTNGMWKSYNKKLMTFSLHQIMYDNLSLISSRHCTKGPEGNNWCMRVTLQVHLENSNKCSLYVIPLLRSAWADIYSTISFDCYNVTSLAFCLGPRSGSICRFQASLEHVSRILCKTGEMRFSGPIRRNIKFCRTLVPR